MNSGCIIVFERSSYGEIELPSEMMMESTDIWGDANADKGKSLREIGRRMKLEDLLQYRPVALLAHHIYIAMIVCLSLIRKHQLIQLDRAGFAIYDVDDDFRAARRPEAKCGCTC